LSEQNQQLEQLKDEPEFSRAIMIVNIVKIHERVHQILL